LVRAAALYLPILLTLALTIHQRPDRRQVAGALVATAWNLPPLLALNLIAVRAGWWTFEATQATVSGIPADLWIGWALLWGAVPALVGNRPLVVLAGGLVVADLVLMPLAQPVVILDSTWLLGELVAVVTCLVPALLIGRWTSENLRVNGRATLQVVAFAGLLLFVLPSLIFTITDETWAPLLDRPRWQFVIAALALAPVGAMALQAVREFAINGGTPVPLDPPTNLVTTGPYAYVANPMQLSASLLLAAWGLLLASPALVAGAVVAAAFSAGLAAYSETGDLDRRFRGDWRCYRRGVRVWVPRWRPIEGSPATVYVAISCDRCSEVGRFLHRRRSVGLDVRPAERCGVPFTRITYVRAGETASGVAAIGRSLEHVNLAWATGSWIARLPGLRHVLQLITDAVGGGPRSLPRAATAIGDPWTGD
jgi:protein-S-isoprenylcysteine O-methyltransferase Ste14